MATLTQNQIDELALVILGDDIEGGSIHKIGSKQYFEEIFHGFEECFFDTGDMQGLDSEDRRAVFAKCMETFNDPEYNATYSIGFIRGLKDACGVIESVTLTF